MLAGRVVTGRHRVDEEVEDVEEGERGSSPLPLRALTVVHSAGDRAVRVRWLLSLIRPAHSRSSAQHTTLLHQGGSTSWHIQYVATEQARKDGRWIV